MSQEFNLSELINQIQYNCGAAPDKISFDGKIDRFDIGKKGNKAGWIYSISWNFNAKDYAICIYGSWKQGSKHIWRSYSKEDELNVSGLLKSVKNAQEKIDLEQAEFKAKKKIEILDKLKSFKKVWSENVYLKKKQIQSYADLLEDHYKNLIVPIYEDVDKNPAGFQRIMLDKKTFPTGQEVQGNFYYFGNLKTAEFIYLCEGFATGATIHELTGAPTVVAFQANNLPFVASKLKHSLNGVKMVIAADNDQNKTNAGMYWAKRAKELCGNIAIVKPNFESGSSLTDFNDLFVSQGRDITLAQLDFSEEEFTKVELLGFDQGKYFFYSTKTKEISSMSLDKMKRGHLIELAIESYWAQKYTPNFDKDLLLPLESCNWHKTASQIVNEQNNLGPFLSHKIRGVGSWVEDDKHILNLGSSIFLNSEPHFFGKSNVTKKFYKPNLKIDLTFDPDLESDFTPLVDAVKLIDFKSDRDRIIYLGFLAYAQVFTTQRWRPHLWVRADKGTGKSSLLAFTNELIQNSTMFQDSTAAGIRQHAGSDSRVCLVDEAEGESYKTRQLVELSRQSSSGSGVKVARGTPEGKAINFEPELCFFFASIRAAELTPADESRILQIAMKKSEGPKNLKLLSSKMHDAKKLSLNLFSYMNKNLSEYNQAVTAIKDEFLKAGFDARYSDQHSPILAGYYMLNKKADLNDAMLKLSEDDIEEIGDTDSKSDQKQFYDVFMSLLVRVENEDQTLSQIFEDYEQSGTDKRRYLDRLLKKYSIQYLQRKKRFFVAQNNNLQNLFTRQTKFKNYYAQMTDSKFFEKSKTKANRGYEIVID